MKKILFFFTFFLPYFCANAQVVTFSGHHATWDKNHLEYKGNLAKYTNYQYLKFINNTDYNVYVNIHSHHDVNLIWFVYDNGEVGAKVKVTIPPRQTYSLNTIAYLASGATKIYHDELGLDIDFYNEDDFYSSTYLDVNCTVNISKKNSNDHSHDHNDNNSNSNNDNGNNNSNTTFKKPSNYEYIAAGGKPARFKISDLPLTVYSNHSGLGSSRDYEQVLKKSVAIWNEAGRSIGLDVDFFKISTRSSADVEVDWTGTSVPVPSGALGVAYPGGNRVGMLSMSRYNSLGGATETLCQELCHLLGVEHSGERYDIMNGVSHGHKHDMSEIKITERDRVMLGWLYSLKDYYRFTK